MKPPQDFDVAWYLRITAQQHGWTQEQVRLHWIAWIRDDQRWHLVNIPEWLQPAEQLTLWQS